MIHLLLVLCTSGPKLQLGFPLTERSLKCGEEKPQNGLFTTRMPNGFFVVDTCTVKR